jgi:hypothetical protein
MSQVYSDGTLCLDIIQEHWSPCHNICSILTSIQSLLTDPNCASPANPEAAQVRSAQLGSSSAGHGCLQAGQPAMQSAPLLFVQYRVPLA